MRLAHARLTPTLPADTNEVLNACGRGSAGGRSSGRRGPASAAPARSSSTARP